jgi:hypothetical protein
VLVVKHDPGAQLHRQRAARELGFVVVEADCAPVALEHLDRDPNTPCC